MLDGSFPGVALPYSVEDAHRHHGPPAPSRRDLPQPTGWDRLGPCPDGPGRLHRLARHRGPDRTGGAVGDHQPPHRLPAQTGTGRRGGRGTLLKLGKRLAVAEVAIYSEGEPRGGGQSPGHLLDPPGAAQTATPRCRLPCAWRRPPPTTRSLRRRAPVPASRNSDIKGEPIMHDLVIRGGTVVDGTGAGPDRRRHGGPGTDHRRRLVRRRTGQPDRRRRRSAGHPGVGGHPHPLRRPGHLGRGAGPEQLARGDHHGHGQLRRRVRPGPARPPRVADRPDGGRRGHPRDRRWPRACTGSGRPSPSTSTPSTGASGPWTSAPRSPTAPSAPT